MTRLSAINTLEKGSIKMIDIESMIKALRLAWLKRILILIIMTVHGSSI